VAKRKKGDHAIIASLTEHQVRALIHSEADRIGWSANYIGQKDELLAALGRQIDGCHPRTDRL
jgi:hypothetical protein